MIAKIIDSGTIEVYDLSQFDADAIMHSGQVFRYFQTPKGYELIAGKNYAEIHSEEDKAIIKCNDSKYFWDYFDLDTDYNKIKQDLFQYEKIRLAIIRGGGIRILRADFIETVISFIISANNNIKRFTKTLNLLAERCGEKLNSGQYAFPSLECLLGLDETEYARLGCGYRSPYLVSAVQSLMSLDSVGLSRLDDSALSKELQQIKGVGNKVASCIMLFCGDFHRLNVVPIDTWIAKALKALPDEQKTALLNHKYAGIAQQYIFYYLQHLNEQL